MVQTDGVGHDIGFVLQIAIKPYIHLPLPHPALIHSFSIASIFQGAELQIWSQKYFLNRYHNSFQKSSLQFSWLQHSTAKLAIYMNLSNSISRVTSILPLLAIATYCAIACINPDRWHLGRQKGVWASILAGFHFNPMPLCL